MIKDVLLQGVHCAVKLHLKLSSHALQLFFCFLFFVNLFCVLTDSEFLGVIKTKFFLPQKKSVIRPGVVTIIDTLKIGSGEVQ